MPLVRENIFDAGMTLDAAYVDSPVCCPSRTSLFSGRMAHNLNQSAEGWCGNFTAGRENVFTTSIKTAGYTIGQFGKWYNEEPAFCVEGYTPVWHQDPNDDFFVMCQEVKYYNMTWNDNGNLTATGDRPHDYLTSVIGNRTMQWLNKVTASSEPWLGYVAVHAPHLPATPAPWYLNASVPGTGAPRTPNFNAGYADKHFAIDNRIDKPMSDHLIKGTDALWANRLRALMSVDDLVSDIFGLLQQRGALDNTYVFYTSDHGYHLGQWGVWSEKANPYEFDAHVPLAVRGPGIQAGSSSSALVSNVDLAPTMLELAGIPNIWPDGSGQRDGRSIVPVLMLASTAGSAYEPSTGSIPAGWRDRLLIQFVGWITPFQWLAPCQFELTASPCDANPHAGMTNAANNRYTSIRVVNATHNFLYAEYRPPLASIVPSATNWTEAYNVTADPWQMTNLAVKNRLPQPLLAAMRQELWEIANCFGTQCP